MNDQEKEEVKKVVLELFNETIKPLIEETANNTIKVNKLLNHYIESTVKATGKTKQEVIKEINSSKSEISVIRKQ